MKASSLCCCCLLKTSDKDLQTPYNRLGTTEILQILSEMLEECFQIQLTLYTKEEYGINEICSVCEGRLRDASDFKQQVQRSQEKLRASLERPLHGKDLEQLLSKMAAEDGRGTGPLLHGAVALKTEFVECTETTDDMLYERGSEEVKLEVFDYDTTNEQSYDPDSISNPNQNDATIDEEEQKIKTEKSDDEDVPTFSRQGIGAPSLRTYSRRPAHEAPRERHLWPTLDLEPTTTTNKIDDTLEVRAADTPRTIRHKLKSSRLEEHKDTDKNNSKHRTYNDDNKYICDICDKQFQKKQCLATHVRMHTERNYFFCRVCKKKLTKKGCLKPICCEEKYICDICDKEFKKKKSIFLHMTTHIGRKLFTCDICKKKFVKKSLLWAHKKTHTELKPFSCEQCNKRFTLKSNLTKHTQLHTGLKPFACDICGTKFLRKYSLMLHIRTHTGQRPYRCDICTKTFLSSSHLIRHKKSHTGQKFFSCGECNKQFTRKASLNIHKRRRHT